MQCLVVLLLLLVSAEASAAGISSSFKVRDFYRLDSESARFLLLPVDRNALWGFETCEQVLVSAKRKPEPFWRRTWSAYHAAGPAHVAALDLLSHAADTDQTIRFGVMGSGLMAIPGKPCEAESRGLELLKEGAGEVSEAIYSFYGAM